MSKIFTSIIVIVIVLVLGIIGWNFSTNYVNMGSLLPSKVELSNSFRGDASSSIVQGTTVNIVFTYLGVKPINIVKNKGEIVTTAGNCNLNKITPKTNFRNRDKGVLSFSCSQDIINNMDRQLEGNVSIYYISNNIEMKSSGPIRLNIK